MRIALKRIAGPDTDSCKVGSRSCAIAVEMVVVVVVVVAVAVRACVCVYESMLRWETVRPLCGYHGYCINHRSPASVPSAGIKSL